MEIEVNDYIRTKTGKIYTVKGINIYGDGDIHYLVKESIVYVRANKVVKHSKNIIDLIEVGDFVNGHKIIIDLQKSKKHYNTENNFVTAVGYTFTEEEIKTILTHEQYTQNAYRMEE